DGANRESAQALSRASGEALVKLIILLDDISRGPEELGIESGELFLHADLQQLFWRQAKLLCCLLQLRGGLLRQFQLQCFHGHYFTLITFEVQRACQTRL